MDDFPADTDDRYVNTEDNCGGDKENEYGNEGENEDGDL